MGEFMDSGCSQSDYVITVGDGPCSVTALAENQVVCRPPETKPGLGDNYKKHKSNNNLAPSVTVCAVSVLVFSSCRA